MARWSVTWASTPLDCPTSTSTSGEAPARAPVHPSHLFLCLIHFPRPHPTPSYLIVPTKWEESRTGLSALQYFRESELKHCRIAMLAVLGWVAVDLGLRFPSSKYADLNPIQAHDAFVKSGDMFVALLAIGFLEVVTGVGIYEMAKVSQSVCLSQGSWGWGRA